MPMCEYEFGTACQLGAQVAPDQPVIVLGVSERTDDAGNVLQAEPVAEPVASTQLAAASSYQVRMVQGHLISNKERWAKDDAEISVRRSGLRSRLHGHQLVEPRQ